MKKVLKLLTMTLVIVTLLTSLAACGKKQMTVLTL